MSCWILILGGLTSAAGSSLGLVGCVVQHDAPLVAVLVTERCADEQ